MEKSVSKKFRVRPGDVLCLFNAPQDFKKTIGTLPEGSCIDSNKEPDQIHWFVKTEAEVRNQLPAVLKKLGTETILWTYFPKGRSGMQSDLTRDKGWDELMKEDLQWLNLISFDETWSAFAMKRKSGKAKEKLVRSEPEFPDFIDKVKRTVKVPADLAEAFKKHDKLKLKFESLAFTHKKEFVQWILSAKKKETRQKRVAGTIEKLKL